MYVQKLRNFIKTEFFKSGIHCICQENEKWTFVLLVQQKKVEPKQARKPNRAKKPKDIKNSSQIKTQVFKLFVRPIILFFS